MPPRSQTRINSRESGFTLIEFMVVVAIIAILVALAFPLVRNGRIAGNEASAIQSLRTITSVNEQYRSRFGSYAGALSDLQTAGYLDANLGGGAKSGYGFVFPSAGTNATWSVQADPADPGETGFRYFFCDESGVIRFGTATADSSSSPLE